MPKVASTPETVETTPVATAAVAVVNPQRTVQQYAPPPARDDSWDDVDGSAFLVPRLSMIQPASRRDGAEDHPGGFFRNTDSKYFDKLNVVLLKMEPNNTLWGPQGTKLPECTSSDHRTGTVYGSCLTCRFNRFGNSEESRALNEKLERGEQAKSCQTGGWNFIVATPDDDEVALLGVHGKNVAPMKRLVSSLRTKGLPMYGAPVTLVTKGDKNAKGRFYVLAPEVGTRFGAEERASWRERWEALRGLKISGGAPDDDTAATDGGFPSEIPDEELAF